MGLLVNQDLETAGSWGVGGGFPARLPTPLTPQQVRLPALVPGLTGGLP